MKKLKFTNLRLVTMIVFILIMGTAILFMAITYYAAEKYRLATTQLVNREVASHIAIFSSPFDNKGINKKLADSIFHNAMVLSPSIEVYFLDTIGQVMAYHGKDGDILTHVVPLDPVLKYIASDGKLFIKGVDPRDPIQNKIFSSTEVRVKDSRVGFIYVILDSREFREANASLFNTHINNLLIKAFVFVIISSIVITFLYLRRVERTFTRMTMVLERFREGDYNARFTNRKKSEFSFFTDSFNRMADLLQHNIKKLTQSEEDRKQLVVNISHDLRTPLSIARGYAETLILIKEDPSALTSERLNEFSQLIIQHIKQVEQMVMQLFELSKIESVGISPQKQPFIFSEIVLEIVNSMKLTADQKNITIDCSDCRNYSWIDADIKMMESVVQNIILNAISYSTENNSINISIHIEGSYVVFRVENPGDPLSPEMLDWLNNTAGSNDRSSPKATIGLTIVKKIIQIHQYSLVVRSETGKNKFIIRMDYAATINSGELSEYVPSA